MLEPKPHKTFKRVGNDLILDKDITLQEALTGFSFDVNHLDERVLQVGALGRIRLSILTRMLYP